MHLYYNILLCKIKMADFERRQFEIGLEFVHRSSTERNNFRKVSSKPRKTPLYFECGGGAAPQVFELEILIIDHKQLVEYSVQ